jgi:hypothetical protein
MVCSLSTGVDGKVDWSERSEKAGSGIKFENWSSHLSSLSTAPHCSCNGNSPTCYPWTMFRFAGFPLLYQDNWSLIARSRAILEKAVVEQLIKNFLTIYATSWFTVVFTRFPSLHYSEPEKIHFKSLLSNLNLRLLMWSLYIQFPK